MVQIMESHQETLRKTLWEYIYTLQVESFLVCGVFEVRKTSGMHFAHLCGPHDVIGHLVIGHTLTYTLYKFEVN